MNYVAPTTVEEAAELLSSAADSRVLAGATDWIPQLRAGRPEPELLVDLKRIPRLLEIGRDGDGTWTIGAAAPAAAVVANEGLRAAFPGLTEASSLIGSDQIQNRASLGGNLCNASPAADTVPSMIVNEGRGVFTSSAGTRVVPIAEVVTGPGLTSLRPGEFLVELLFDSPPPRTGDAYLRFIPRTEMDIAVVGAAARISVDENGVCTAATLALGAVAPTVVRVPAAEEALVGSPISDDTLASVESAASEACNPIDDKRGTIAFRRQVAGVLAKRAVLLAAQRVQQRDGGQA